MLDQSGDVRHRVFQVGSSATYFVFAYNYAPTARTNVTFTFDSAVSSVTVIDEARTITPSGSTWTDTFGGSSSLTQGASRNAHIYQLTLAPLTRPSGLNYNSIETGCDGTDAHVMFCDDFEADGTGNTALPTWFVDGSGATVTNKGWVSYDGNPSADTVRATRCGAGVTPFGNCAASTGRHIGTQLTAQYTCGDSVLNVVSTAEFPASETRPLVDVGSGSTPYRLHVLNTGPDYAFRWTGKNATQFTGVNVGTQFGGACSSGNVTISPNQAWAGVEGAVNIAEHGVPGGAQELYVRYYYFAVPGYIWGAEKHLTVNPGNPGDGGILFFTCAFNAFNNAVTVAGFLCGGPDGNFDTNVSSLSYTAGRWYFHELHFKISTTASSGDGIIEWWANDCGPVASFNCGAAPTRRALWTGLNFSFVASNGNKIGRLWWEGWANAASMNGYELYDQIKVSTVGPNGFSGGAPPPTPPAAPTGFHFGP